MTDGRGRPTKYCEQAQEAADNYIVGCRKEGLTPFVEELALQLDVDDDTLAEWVKNHEEFSATMKRLKILQRLHLKRDALHRKTQPHIAIFLLKVNHGLNEKEPQQNQIPQSLLISFKSADEVIAEIEKQRMNVSSGETERV